MTSAARQQVAFALCANQVRPEVGLHLRVWFAQSVNSTGLQFSILGAAG